MVLEEKPVVVRRACRETKRSHRLEKPSEGLFHGTVGVFAGGKQAWTAWAARCTVIEIFKEHRPVLRRYSGRCFVAGCLLRIGWVSKELCHSFCRVLHSRHSQLPKDSCGYVRGRPHLHAALCPSHDAHRTAH